jgi:hypothetical protein
MTTAASTTDDARTTLVRRPYDVRAIPALRHGSPDDAIAHVHGPLIKMRELHDNVAFVYALIPLAAGLKGEDTWAAQIDGTEPMPPAAGCRSIRC